MSVDYYLVSPSRKKGVQIGSIGFSGVQSYPASDECVSFVRWAIEEAVGDVVMVDEHRYHEIVGDDENEDEYCEDEYEIEDEDGESDA